MGLTFQDLVHKCPRCARTIDLKDAQAKVWQALKQNLNTDLTLPCPACKKPVLLKLRFQPVLTLVDPALVCPRPTQPAA